MRLFLIGILLFVIQFGNSQNTIPYLDSFNFVSSDSPAIQDAMAFLRVGDPDGAIEVLKSLDKKDQKSYEAFFLKGLAFKMKGDLTSAIQGFSSAIHDDGFFLPAFFERGNCYLIRENYRLAVFDFDRVLLIDSNFVPAYNNRAYARIRNYGDQENPVFQLKFAREDLKRGIQITQLRGLAPTFESYYNLGLVELFQSEYAAAASAFDVAIQVNSQIAKAYYFRGAARFLNRAYDSAAEDFKQAESMGFISKDTPEFLRVISLIEDHNNSIPSRE